VPGDYDGDLSADLAVFRPATGAWYVEGMSPVFFGAGVDYPLPLPAAIRVAAVPSYPAPYEIVRTSLAAFPYGHRTR
jgi:hypothetical protein